MSTNNPVIALAGNPNVGKTTLFNALTGSHQVVGNWPGVTVEHKQGYYLYQGKRYEVIDLPGIYSLSGGTPDELVARDFILYKKPDLVINIVDSSNLERNLYLSVQLMELGAPMLMLLSMCDITVRNGIRVDDQHLSSHVGIPVLPATLNHGFDSSGLLERIASTLQDAPKPALIRYDEVVETALDRIVPQLRSMDSETGPIQLRWQALKLLEQDPALELKLNDELRLLVEKEIKAIEKHRGQASPNLIADDRYGFIRGLAKDVITRASENKLTYSDRVDKIALSGVLGLPLFFFVMYLVFLLAVRASGPIIDLIDGGLSWLLVEQWGALLRSLRLPEGLVFMLSDALGGGIVTIGTFVPPIFFIFASLSILEDSGYMARAAFIADKFMRRIGLPGKAFIPLLVGFGCTVPAIMATRTLESKRDRVFASLLSPFMSCGAKLPVYTYLAMVFFPRRADLVIFGLYFFGVLMAMIFGLMLKKTLFKTQPGNFVMELPPYHFPTFNGIMLHTWHRLKDFVLRAGKTILTVILVMNLLQVITLPSASSPEGKISVLELAGKGLTPLLAPMGIRSENWQAGVALVSGLFAKEAIVGTLQGLYQGSGTEEAAQTALLSGFGSTAAVLAYLVFVLLYSPCAAALAMLFKEHGWRWMAFSFAYLTLLAWIMATLVYQLLVFSAASILWIGIALLMGLGFYISMQLLGRSKHHAFQS
ncbi:MAG TPA: ferrous iron transport protein B [Candidatus Cloacimonadota bacterium]|nr:ferrous iron transport protein B [Candidatus Cloacimonadota bacterium]